jgi:hypothetical protein
MSSSVRECICACQAGCPRTEFKLSALPRVSGTFGNDGVSRNPSRAPTASLRDRLSRLLTEPVRRGGGSGRVVGNSAGSSLTCWHQLGSRTSGKRICFSGWVTEPVDPASISSVAFVGSRGHARTR